MKIFNLKKTKIMKIVLIKIPFGHEDLLTIGNVYSGEVSPQIYDPNTFLLKPPAYIVKCDDGKFRKVETDFFITLEECREIKLKQILDERNINLE
jgi:hypothetical protein